MNTEALLPLLDRPGNAALFHLPGRTITVRTFLADATAIAHAMPAHAYVVNLCRDRYGFAAGLAAALLRGQTSLLSGNPSPAVLNWLIETYGDAYILTDHDDDRLDPLPRHRIVHESEPVAGCSDIGIHERQPAIIAFTSGTTGRPAGTGKCWGELVARSRAAGFRFALSETAPTAIVATVPPGHMYGLETSILLPLHAAVSVWCGPAFFPADISAALDGLAGPRTLVTTPLHLRLLLQNERPRRPPERIISATAPLDRELALKAERLWGSTVFEIFGATESGSIASRQTTSDAYWTLYPDIVLSGSHDAPLVQGPFAEPRRLADMIARSNDGQHFQLIGRTSDLVKLGGRRASLSGLTRILTGIPGVRDGAFLAPDDPDHERTARLLAAAVAPSHSVASLTAALRAVIDPIFLPRPLVLLDALPRDALGKLPRDALLAAIKSAAP